MPKQPTKRVEDSHEGIVVTYSEMDAFRQCPLKHQWSYVQGWRQDVSFGTPLSRGGLWHNAMEINYTWLQRSPNADLELVRKFIYDNLLVDPETGEQNEDQVLIQWMLDGHHTCFGRDPQWEILEIEGAHKVRLGPPSSKFWLAFKLDLLVRERKTNHIWLVDHKSARDFSRQTEIDIDDQFGLYSWGLRQLGVDVFGTIRSDARTQRNKGPMAMDQRFRRVPTFRTQKELNRIAADAYDTARSAYSGHRVVYSAPAPDRCTWRCSYLQPHLMIRKGFEPDQVMKDFGFNQSGVKHREYETNPLLERIPVNAPANP